MLNFVQYSAPFWLRMQIWPSTFILLDVFILQKCRRVLLSKQQHHLQPFMVTVAPKIRPLPGNKYESEWEISDSLATQQVLLRGLCCKEKLLSCKFFFFFFLWLVTVECCATCSVSILPFLCWVSELFLLTSLLLLNPVLVHSSLALLPVPFILCQYRWTPELVSGYKTTISIYLKWETLSFVFAPVAEM